MARNRRRLVLGCLASILVTAGGVFLYSGTCGFHGCPSAREIRTYAAGHGRTIGLGRIPRNVRNAFIAVEDRRFADHHGIDWRAVGRASVRNAASLGVREGGSTLTMQVARLAFIPPSACSERSVGRKLIEMELAPRIERTLTKDQILQLYLNLIYLGDGVYGVEGASRHYFGKSVTKLSLAEAAMLAALPRAPSIYDPKDHPDRALARRDLVLNLMAKEGYITVAQAREAADTRLAVAGGPRRQVKTGPVVAVVNEVPNTDRGRSNNSCQS
jgi:membrane peptidoglycan carboxypeptidase